jgi:phage tail P2-like protein
MMNSILPPNASILEKDIEDAAGKVRIEAIDLPVGNLWNPQTIPAQILPYLAWALSVDTWDNQWPENIKRQVIAASVEVHRKKGTVGAVKKAITAIDIDADFTEWFQNGGAPHTFGITAWSNNNRDEEGKTKLLPRAYTDIKNGVNATKPVRAHFELMFGSKLPSDVGAGFESNITSRANNTTEIVPYPSRSNSTAYGKYDSHVPARTEHVNEIIPYTSKTGAEVGGGYSSHVTVRAADSVEVIPYTGKANSETGAVYSQHITARTTEDFEIMPYTNSTNTNFGILGSINTMPRINLSLEF